METDWSVGAATSDPPRIPGKPSDAKKKEKKNSNLYISERAGPADMFVCLFVF